MPFLANEEIKAKTDLFVGQEGPDEDYDFKNCLQQCSYDLRLGDQIYVVGKKAPFRLTRVKPYVSIAPGEFAILTCLEKLNMPDDVLGFINVRSTFKKQGLVNISGFHVDPTFKGRLVFAVQNVGPSDITLKFRSPTFTIFFSRLSSKTTNPRQRPVQEGIELGDIQLLGGSSVTLNKLKSDVDRLRLYTLIYAPFAVGAFIALLISLLKLLFPETFK
jgi:dCTP deaminase